MDYNEELEVHQKNLNEAANGVFFGKRGFWGAKIAGAVVTIIVLIIEASFWWIGLLVYAGVELMLGIPCLKLWRSSERETARLQDAIRKLEERV